MRAVEELQKYSMLLNFKTPLPPFIKKSFCFLMRAVNLFVISFFRTGHFSGIICISTARRNIAQPSTFYYEGPGTVSAIGYDVP
jgi:hypothetical protein